MDPPESEEAQVGKKIPIERLSKEELVKKYRQAILIAQKAKESKVEIMKHFSQREKLVESLEERVQKSEEEKAKEANLREDVEVQLKNAKELIETLTAENLHLKDFRKVKNDDIQLEMVKNDNEREDQLANTNLIALKESLESEIKKYCSENAKLLSDLEVSSERIQTLEAELMQVRTDFERFNEVHDQSLNLITAKDLELESLKETIKEMEANGSCMVDLTTKIQSLQENFDSERRLAKEESLEWEKKLKSIQELVLEKDECIRRQEESITEMKTCFEELQRELSQKQSLLDSSNAKIIELESEETSKNAGKKCDDDTIENKTLEISHLKEEILKRDEGLCLKENTITKLLEEVQGLKESLYECKFLSSESSTKMNLLESKNNFLLEKINSLESESTELHSLATNKIEEIKRLEEFVTNLKILMGKLQSELLDKESFNNDRVTKLVKELERYKKIAQDRATDDTFDKLNQKIVKKDEDLCEKEKCITHLESKLQTMQEKLDHFELFSSESASKIDLLTSENSSFSHRLSSLIDENGDLNSLVAEKLEETAKQTKLVSDLQVVIEELQKEVLEKGILLQRSGETEALLNSTIEKLSMNLQECVSKHDVEAVTEEKAELENVIQQKVKEIQIRDERIAQFLSNIAEMQSKLEAAESHKLKIMSEVEEKENKLKESEEKISLYETKLSALTELEQELKDQLSSVQSILSEKENQVRDLEEEVYKLKEAAAHESTNTEISSTFSLSRAEELSRMKDLEDSFEDKYTKLRVVAVKLKKRVTELTQTLELERSKMATERSDLQARLTQLASHAKTVQSLQSEVDRLQDLLEEQKKVQQLLTKDLESAVKEAASRKFELASVQEELLRSNSEKKSLETSVSSLESTLTQTNGLQSEIDKLCKELKEKDIVLGILKEEKQRLSEQLEKVCADAKNKSVLSLEIADMEKSVSELTRQLSSERERLKNTENELEQEHSLLLTLQDKLKILESNLEKKEASNQDIKGKLAVSKGETKNLEGKFKEMEARADQLSTELEKQRSLVEELNIQCSNLAAKEVQGKENARLQIETLSRQVFQLEEQSSLLKESHKAVEDELASVRTEFENYKVRAQSVLRQSAKQEERVTSSSTVHNVEELEVEVERLRVNVSNLKENLRLTMSQLQAALQDVNVEKEEKAHATKQAQVLKESCAQAIERQHAAEERLSAILEESKQTKLHSDMLIQCYKQQLEDLKTTHQKKVASLTEQVQNLQVSITKPILPPVESEQASRLPSGPSPVGEWTVFSANTAHSDTDLATRLSSLQREEGEGSESVDLFPSRRISVTTQERRHELVPLDKLLSSQAYPDDDTRDVARANSSDLNVDLLQSQLSACESRAAHLTALLSEAESDAARLSQLNAVLKEEIRRQQRCEERAQHAHNLEYLKNIVVKFITLQNGDERQRLVPVLNTILKLSPEESNLIATVTKGVSQANNAARGWGSYLPLPGWTGS